MSCGSLDRRGVWGRMDTCVCAAESFGCSPETTTTLLISYTLIQNKKFKVWKKEKRKIKKKIHLCPWGSMASVKLKELLPVLLTNKNLLYSTWNSAQCYVPGWM